MRLPSGDTDGDSRAASLHGVDAGKIIGVVTARTGALRHASIATAATPSDAARSQATISRPWTGRRVATPPAAGTAPEPGASVIAWSANAKSRADWKRWPGSFSIAW